MKTFRQFINETIDPNQDEKDLYIHPERYIDKSVLPFVLKLWKHKIKTWESGGDEDITDTIIDSDTPTPSEWMNHAIKNDYLKREYILGNRLREKAFVIINKKDFETAKHLLPSNLEVEEGTGGFSPQEYNSNVPHPSKLLYIQFRIH